MIEQIDQMEPIILDIKESGSYPKPKIIEWHPEKAKMTLAYWVLAAIFLIFLISVGANYLAKNDVLDAVMANDLFSFCKSSLLPLVTLILGYYFGKSE